MIRSRIVTLVATLGGSAALAGLAAAPLFAGAADHLDAPGVTSPSARADADITDVYAFQGADASRTALVLDTHPAAGAIAPLDYASDVDYVLNVDRDGDAVQDLAYVVRFGAGNGTGAGQRYTVTRYTGSNARTLRQGVSLGGGTTGHSAQLKDAARTFVGLRSDPFFFDLGAFLGEVAGSGNGRTFCDASANDFFAPLNVNAIVLEVPDDALGGTIGYWGATRDGSGQIDRMGRPAINTVFNKGADKNAFNHGQPRNDFRDFSGNVIKVLEALGGYDEATATSLAHVLLPDVLTYDTATTAAGPLNGRALADDVIDAELNIVTQGGVRTDCVGPHSDYQATFPYLGVPHS